MNVSILTKKVRRVRKKRSKEENRVTASVERDDPLRRHEETKMDTRIGSEGKDLAELRLKALQSTRRAPSNIEDRDTI